MYSEEDCKAMTSGVWPRGVKGICRTNSNEKKYIDHVYTLYSFFHITVMPLLDNEVRGRENIIEFSKMLANPINYDPNA